MTERKIINIALAGNANVGKSVVFNQLTGMNQCIGNWPGKTVAKCEGKLTFLNYNFNIVDLPGIYSLSTYSIEEIISREFLIGEKVDLIINIIDGTNLERNLFFTVQLIGLKLPMILAINQLDLVRKRKIEINLEKLEEIFKIPVMPVIAVHGRGVHELLEKAIEMFENKFQIPDEDFFRFGKEVETGIQKLIEEINNYTDELKEIKYPNRFLAIKILEKDDELIEKIKRLKPEIIDIAADIREELEEIHGEDINTIISTEIYNRIHKVIDQSMVYGKKQKKATWVDKFDHLTTHSIFGYAILFIILFGVYWVVFTVGIIVGGWLDELYEFLTPFIFTIFGDNIGTNIFWNGAMAGLFGGVGGVLVYVVPFFLIIEILQDSGYLPRAAFIMDKFMHQIGVHGKAIIPLILSFGCNVPGCSACRIMETERERRITAFLTTLIPCAAVMAVIMGLVAKYLGFIYAIILYGIDFAVIILFGKLATKYSTEPQTELIMEMHEFRKPNTSVILKQTWFRSKEFVYKAMPLIIIVGMLMEIMLMFNLLEPINVFLQPITVLWLGLPVITGIFLIYGILRKELTLVLLEILAVDILGIALNEFMTPIQMFVFALVSMLYIPCAATIIVLKNETDWKFTLKVTFVEIGFAILLGGIVNWGYIFITGGG